MQSLGIQPVKAQGDELPSWFLNRVGLSVLRRSRNSDADGADDKKRPEERAERVEHRMQQADFIVQCWIESGSRVTYPCESTHPCSRDGRAAATDRDQGILRARFAGRLRAVADGTVGGMRH